MRIAILAAAALTLAACQSESPAETPPPPVAEDGCGMVAVGKFIGGKLTPTVEAEISATISGTHRVIRPGDAVTMDFRADRLNIELDRTGKIKLMRCG